MPSSPEKKFTVKFVMDGLFIAVVGMGQRLQVHRALRQHRLYGEETQKQSTAALDGDGK